MSHFVSLQTEELTTKHNAMGLDKLGFDYALGKKILTLQIKLYLWNSNLRVSDYIFPIQSILVKPVQLILFPAGAYS